jgi:hypothetical protein
MMLNDNIIELNTQSTNKPHQNIHAWYFVPLLNEANGSLRTDICCQFRLR